MFGIRVIAGKKITDQKRKYTWCQSEAAFLFGAPSPSFEARRFKKAQARRCPRRCSLSSLSTTTLVAAVEGANCPTEL